MSRIGKLPIALTKGVSVKVEEGKVTVKGPLGELSQNITGDISISEENGFLNVKRANDARQNVALHGLYRALVFNMVKGVTSGYEKSLLISGVGYKVSKQGKKLVMNIGFSHPVEIDEPEGVSFATPTPTEILVKGIDKTLVGQISATIKAVRPVEPYHNYGIRYKGETVIKKEGKKAGKK